MKPEGVLGQLVCSAQSVVLSWGQLHPDLYLLEEGMYEKGVTLCVAIRAETPALPGAHSTL